LKSSWNVVLLELTPERMSSTEADLLPDETAGTLTVRVHHQANRCTDEVIRHLCTELNQTETIFPGTNLRLVYELVSD
jgi:hypothetical protein